MEIKIVLKGSVDDPGSVEDHVARLKKYINHRGLNWSVTTSIGVEGSFTPGNQLFGFMANYWPSNMGYSNSELAQVFGINRSSVYKMMRRQAEEGHVSKRLAKNGTLYWFTTDVEVDDRKAWQADQWFSTPAGERQLREIESLGAQR